MKKIIKVILAISAVVFILLAISFGRIIYLIKFAKTEVLTTEADDGEHSLTVYQIGEPEWPFGLTHCRLDLYEGKKRIIKEPVAIADDGAVAYAGNFLITWQEDRVDVKVVGSEQEPEMYKLFFDGKVKKN